MKLIGFAFAGAARPLDEGYVSLDDLAVAIGPNDSGKSSLLKQLRAHLMAADLAEPLRGPSDGSAAFYMQCSGGEFDLIARHALDDLLVLEPGEDNLSEFDGEDEDSVSQTREFWALGGWKPDELDGHWLSDPATYIDDYVELLRSAACPGAPSSKRVLQALRSSGLVALELATQDVSRQPPPALNVYWCLPAFETLPEDIQADLKQSELLAWGESVRFKTGLIAQASEEQWPTKHLRMPTAPVAIAPLGQVRLPLLPRPVAVPTSSAELRAEVVRATTTAVEHLRWGLDDRLEEARSSKVVPPRAPADVWLDGDGISGRWLHERAVTVLSYLGRTATQFLPNFVSTRYTTMVLPADIVTWAGKPDVLLSVLDNQAEFVFGSDDAAEGHRLWFQLALLEAIEALTARVLTWELFADTYIPAEVEAEGLEEEAERWEEGDKHSEEEVQGWAHEARKAAGDAKANYEKVLAAVLDEDGREPRGFELILDETLPIRETTAGEPTQRLDFAFASLARNRVYFVDEPEQHLHPRSQREAARWLESTLREGSSQAVITTHSVSFMRSGSDVAMTYVRRPLDAPSTFTAVTEQDLQALTEVALDLGLDRGELLATKSVFLFVEGRNDQLVLETLWAHELNEYGIAVVPVHSSSKLKGIIDAEVLLRYSSAPAAAWLDNVSVDVADRLRADPDRAHETVADRKNCTAEERALAQVVLTAHQADRPVEALAHPGDDIFDLLDEEAIRTRFPAFPGHAAAKEALHQAQRDGQTVHRKAFYDQTYGIADEAATYRTIAQEMLAQGIKPAAMQEVIARCAELAEQVR